MKAALFLAACVIGGSVHDADTGKPLARTRVFARPLSSGEKPSILRMTDAEGAFCFEQLAAGTYEVVAERAGYLLSVYGARPGGDDGIPFEVKDNSGLPPLTIRMLAGAAIAGTVLDPEGAPLADANVQLSRKVWEKVWTSDHVAQAESDGDGGFRFSMLAPGIYYLSVAPQAFMRGMLDDRGKPVRHNQAETFYTASYTFAHATPIVLKAGEKRAGLEVRVLPSAPRHFSGSLPGGIGVDNGHREPVLELQIEGSMGESVEVPIGKDGTFTAEGLAPAEYRYQLFNQDPGAEGRVDLTAGDVSGFVIQPRHIVDLEVKASVPLMAVDRETMGGRNATRD